MNSGYFYGRSDREGTYESLLTVFSAHESLNSKKTSSLPLVQFWRDDENLDQRLRGIVANIPGVDIRNSAKCFEYATSLPPKTGRGKASMTDLMIISDKWQVAIEAKYTEYLKDPEYRPTVHEWLHERTEERYLANREKVLAGWRTLIGDHCDCIPQNCPYQLVHRIASACHCRAGQSPVLIYHLFYEGKSDAADAFERRLVGWVNDIKLRNVKFIVAKTKVESPTETPKDLSALFEHMNSESPYGDMLDTRVTAIA